MRRTRSAGGSAGRMHVSGKARSQLQPVGLRAVPTSGEHIHDATPAVRARQVDDDVDRERDRLADTLVWQTDIGRQDAMDGARQRLFRRIRMNGAETPQMARVERLQQV